MNKLLILIALFGCSSAPEFHNGNRVLLTAGLMKGCEGLVLMPTPDDETIYRVRLETCPHYADVTKYVAEVSADELELVETKKEN